MKVIIAGSRSIVDITQVFKAMEAVDFKNEEYTVIVSGGAKGVDTLAIELASICAIPYLIFKPDWNNLDVPGAVVKEGQYGKYNAKAGIDRNRRMAEYADALIAVWDSKSKGTLNMIDQMVTLGKLCYVYNVVTDSLIDMNGFHMMEGESLPY